MYSVSLKLRWMQTTDVRERGAAAQEGQDEKGGEAAVARKKTLKDTREHKRGRWPFSRGG